MDETVPPSWPLPKVYAREKGPAGQWHVTRETYPCSASTACGRTVEASLFSTRPTGEELRPELCPACALGNSGEIQR
jgi:hypothetical protein